MADTALKGSTIATSYDWLVFRGDTFSATGNRINLMNDSGVVQPSSLYIDPTNARIGIGAATPQTQLHLDGNAPESAFLCVEDSSNNFITIGTWSSNQAVIGYGDDDNNNVHLNFYSCNDEPFSGTALTMSLTDDNRVGIGTATPDYLVEIEQGASETSITELALTNNDVPAASQLAQACAIYFNLSRSDGTIRRAGMIKVGKTDDWQDGSTGSSNTDSYMDFYTTDADTNAFAILTVYLVYKHPIDVLKLLA